jgi:hypothetical protein
MEVGLIGDVRIFCTNRGVGVGHSKSPLMGVPLQNISNTFGNI